MSDAAARFVWLPVVLTGYFLEALGRATLEMERIATETLDRAIWEGLEPLVRSAVGRSATDRSGADRSGADRPAQDRPAPPPSRPTLDAPAPGAQIPPEDRTMADTNLNDDMVKLIQYAIVSIKRREEQILTEALDDDGTLGRPLLYLETDRLTGDGFSNARIADWVKEHPDKAKEIDLDSLRVYYDVVARWPRSSLKYEEERLDLEDEKIDLLREIARKP